MRSVRFLVVLLVACHHPEGVTDDQLNAINKKMTATESAERQQEGEAKFMKAPGGFPPRQLPPELNEQAVTNVIDGCGNFAPKKFSRIGDVYGNDRHLIVYFTYTAPGSDHEYPARISFDFKNGQWEPSRDIHVVSNGHEAHHMCPK